MAIAGVITNEGLLKCIQAASKGGWHIYPTGFAVSEELGELAETRTYETRNPTWFEGEISGRIVINVHTIEFLCTIPPESTMDSQYIREVYITARDEENNDFLLCMGQSQGDAIYDPSGSVKLRIQVSLQNYNMVDLLVFKYTQAQEIFDHNNDPNAHPSFMAKIIDAIEEHNYNAASHPYILELIKALQAALKNLNNQVASVTGVVIPAAETLSLGQKIHVIKVLQDSFESKDYEVSNRDAKGSLLRIFN